MLCTITLKQLTTFDKLKFSLAARPRGHKQRKLNEHVNLFLLFVSSEPHYQAEFEYIESGLLKWGPPKTFKLRTLGLILDSL